MLELLILVLYHLLKYQEILSLSKVIKCVAFIGQNQTNLEKKFQEISILTNLLIQNLSRTIQIHTLRKCLIYFHQNLNLVELEFY